MTEYLANFQLILATISDGIVVVDQRGVVLYANESAERLFERGELLGKDLAVPIHSGEIRQDINLIRPSGIGWAELRSAPITWDKQPAYVISVRDITERKMADLELHLADTVFDSTREGLMVTDSAQRIVRINPAFAEITGYSACCARAGMTARFTRRCGAASTSAGIGRGKSGIAAKIARFIPS
jgi:PAS domain-containing protein